MIMSQRQNYLNNATTGLTERIQIQIFETEQPKQPQYWEAGKPKPDLQFWFLAKFKTRKP